MTRTKPRSDLPRPVPLDYFAEAPPAAGEPRAVGSGDCIPAMVIVAAPYVLALLLALAGS